MKKLLSFSVLAIFALLVVPSVLAVSVGSGIGIDIVTEDFEPKVWMCDSRVVLDDQTEPGRFDGTFVNKSVSSYQLQGNNLSERFHNYAFEGEQIVWDVVVWDKNGIEKIVDVFATVGDDQGAGNDIEVNCILDYVFSDTTTVPQSCNARILEEEITSFHDNTAAAYTCVLTVETPLSMYGEHWITVEAVDLDGLSGTMDENEYWFLNPEIELSIVGDLVFEDVRPGTQSYSETILVGNDADDGSGVMMDMFITGTDFYDSFSSGAKCPLSNQLELQGQGPDNVFNTADDTGFRYYATSGAYNSAQDANVNTGGGSVTRFTDAEGYTNIEYGVAFNDPSPFYNNAEILQAGPLQFGVYWPANILSPGSEMALTFKLTLPEPCNGDFDSGALYFWGEAV
jgi:hypothetical protein